MTLRQQPGWPKGLPPYVPNEVLITTKREYVEQTKEINTIIPHYLDVKNDPGRRVDRQNDPNIDGVLDRLGLRNRSHTRVYVPRQDVVALKSEEGLLDFTRQVSPEYDYSLEGEDDAEVRLGFARTYRITFDADEDIVPLVIEEFRSLREEVAQHLTVIVAKTVSMGDPGFEIV